MISEKMGQIQRILGAGHLFAQTGDLVIKLRLANDFQRPNFLLIQVIMLPINSNQQK